MLSVPSLNFTQTAHESPLAIPQQVSDLFLNTTDLDQPSLNITSLDQVKVQDDLDLSDIKLTMEQLIAKYGCIGESHVVKTEDDYELKLFRINKDNVSSSKPPVFLQHGIFSDSVAWVMSKERSLAFKLAEAGYDVWIGNNRGDVYSRSNTKYNPDK